MIEDKPRVLIISSCPLSMGPAAIAGHYYDALKRKGIEVDLLLNKPEPGRPDIMYVQKNNIIKNFLFRLLWKIQRILRIKINPLPGYCFFYKKESSPPVSTKRILKQINKQYDLVYVVFWQGLLSFESISKIYEKLHCQFQFAGVDYSQMSGGCHFTNGCERFKIGCGCCPAFNSNDENDFTAWNVRYRKKVYETVKPIVYGNHYTADFYYKSYLLNDARIEINSSAIIDTDVFKPLEEAPLREKLGISTNKRNIIFFACQKLDDDRKGIKYLLEALNILYSRKTECADDILVIMAGRDFENVKMLIPYDSMGVGYVPINILPELFSVSKMFVCPSINDAGPMMVGQSLCCGTPVVGFDMGSVNDLVKEKGTGICVPLGDSQALANGIEKIFKMSDGEYRQMADQCRKIAMNICSFDAQANLILNTYYKYKGK